MERLHKDIVGIVGHLFEAERYEEISDPHPTQPGDLVHRQVGVLDFRSGDRTGGALADRFRFQGHLEPKVEDPVSRAVGEQTQPPKLEIVLGTGDRRGRLRPVHVVQLDVTTQSDGPFFRGDVDPAVVRLNHAVRLRFCARLRPAAFLLERVQTVQNGVQVADALFRRERRCRRRGLQFG